jgi:hypothetical protein
MTGTEGISPLLAFVIALACAAGYVVLSTELVHALAGRDLLPSAWWLRDARRPRTLTLVLELLVTPVVVAFSQWLMVSLAFDAAESIPNRIIGATEVAFAIGWTGRIMLAFLSGRQQPSDP